MEKITLTGRGTFVIRPYQPEDEGRVLSLWKTAFQKEMPEPLWRWKYSENPFGYRILLCVNEAGDPVVMYGGIPYQANWKGQHVEITNLMDIMSHPDYRKTGLFIQTGNAFFDTFCGPDKSVLLYGFPGKYHFEIGQKYMAYLKLKTDVVYLRAETAHLAPSITQSPGYLELVRDIDESFDRLWEICKGSYPLAIIRNAAFIRWRYGNHPLKRYEIWRYQAGQQGAMDAYVVLSIADGKAVLSDILAPPSGFNLSNVFGLLGKMLSDRDISTLETWLPGGHVMMHAALSSGFNVYPEPTGIIPTIRIFDPSLAFEWACDHLYYSMADGDLV
ncbi:MAG: GNAT family N-acetyltransferase [Deltaproteobacteria bacterium]|nr:GNAT family N-acetyltransferase [Deltaproteobacteria bacterium]